VTTHTRPRNEDAINGICSKRIKGLQTYASGVTSIAAKGVTYAPAALIAIYQKCISTRTELAAIRAQEEPALVARNQADADREKVDESVLNWAVETFGPTSQQAKVFGYVARKATKPKAAVVAEGVVKAKATRTARGTGGKKQKAAIKAAPAAATNNNKS
jgi:hypothetical protein